MLRALHLLPQFGGLPRARIALALKGLAYESVPVHLLREGGEQHQSAYRALNPAGLVPALQDNGATITQSMAILEYLEELHPEPALLPPAALDRARVRALAQAVACDIHPLNNLRVLNYLTGQLQVSDAQRTAWMHHWMALGLEAIEQQLAHSPQTGQFCHGDTPTLADCCLVPQVFNAQRFQVDMAPYPTVQRIAAHCDGLPSFKRPTRPGSPTLVDSNALAPCQQAAHRAMHDEGLGGVIGGQHAHLGQGQRQYKAVGGQQRVAQHENAGPSATWCAGRSPSVRPGPGLRRHEGNHQHIHRDWHAQFRRQAPCQRNRYITAPTPTVAASAPRWQTRARPV